MNCSPARHMVSRRVKVFYSEFISSNFVWLLIIKSLYHRKVAYHVGFVYFLYACIIYTNNFKWPGPRRILYKINDHLIPTFNRKRLAVVCDAIKLLARSYRISKADHITRNQTTFNKRPVIGFINTFKY